jgi:hypothetical protein
MARRAECELKCFLEKDVRAAVQKSGPSSKPSGLALPKSKEIRANREFRVVFPERKLSISEASFYLRCRRILEGLSLPKLKPHPRAFRTGFI